MTSDNIHAKHVRAGSLAQNFSINPRIDNIISHSDRKTFLSYGASNVNRFTLKLLEQFPLRGAAKKMKMTELIPVENVSIYLIFIKLGYLNISWSCRIMLRWQNCKHFIP